jgi:hypothetical protein
MKLLLIIPSFLLFNDLAEDASGVRKHLLVREANHTVSALGKDGGSPCILGATSRSEVVPTINLNNEACFAVQEVGIEAVYEGLELIQPVSVIRFSQDGSEGRFRWRSVGLQELLSTFLLPHLRHVLRGRLYREFGLWRWSTLCRAGVNCIRAMIGAESKRTETIESRLTARAYHVPIILGDIAAYRFSDV